MNGKVNTTASPDPFEQNCADYLRHLGVKAEDGQRINAPYRKDADSESFLTSGVFFYDHSHGSGGNVWELAVLMHNGDRRIALKSLYNAVGLPFTERPNDLPALTDREKAKAALAKVRDAFAIGDRTPQEVRDYLDSRKVSTEMCRFFGYVPAGQLCSVLSAEEAALTGLGCHEGRLILWYLRGGHPVYYCTRSIETKEFRKAPTDHLEHPIWNLDDLYTERTVVWSEGMFDGISLKAIGYGVAGEITCYPVKAHLRHLVTALRWRHKHHPDWRFVILLDNDAPDHNGRRPGNEAAERLAVELWQAGLDIDWVRHEPTASKVDINGLHVAGRIDEIHRLVASAKRVSEILPFDSEMTRRNFLTSLANGDVTGAHRLVELMADQQQNRNFAVVVKETLAQRIPYRDLYKDIEMFLHDGDVYVMPIQRIYDKGRPYEVFKKQNLVDNIRRWQRNPAMRIRWEMLAVPAKRPDWFVSKDANGHDDDDAPVHNLFQPSPLLRQRPVAGATMPPVWDRVLDNLAGAAEKEWLVNHMACWVVTLEKPRTVPVLVGRQGTGKTSLFQLFGSGVGDFIRVERDHLESCFNDWLLHAVVLLDELAANEADAHRLRNRLKGLVNGTQSINAKFRQLAVAELNNYVAIASNERVSCVPVVIEPDDRRYTIITGGRDQDLAHEDWFDYRQWEAELPAFMLHLLSRPVDVRATGVPLMNQAKERLIAQSEDVQVAVVREWVEANREATGPTMTGTEICEAINRRGLLREQLTAKRLAPIMRHLAIEPQKQHNQLVYSLQFGKNGSNEP